MRRNKEPDNIIRKGPDGKWSIGGKELSDGDTVDVFISNEWVPGTIKEQGINYVFFAKGSKKAMLLNLGSKIRAKNPG